MKFSYQARTKEGEVQTGFVEASSREAALGVLQKYGLFVTSLTEVKRPFWEKKIEFLRRASKKDVIFFTRQLAVMLRSNVPVVESLETIARQMKKPAFQEAILKIAEEVEGGSTLSFAFSHHKKYFSPFYIGMVNSGETSGKVPASLDYLADHLEKEQDFISNLIVAMIYPVFVLLVFFIITMVMGFFVIPKFKEIFAGMEEDLPLITRIVLNFTNLIKDWWFLGIAFFFAIGLTFFSFLKSKEARKFLDKILLEVPLLGSFLKKFFLARIALNLSTLISGGVPISQALEITGRVVGNDVYRKIILKTRDGVRAGQTISANFAAYPNEFPIFFIQMTIVGEKTGQLEMTLKNVVDLYQKEVDRTLDAMMKFIEPAMIIILGGLVAFLAASLFIPLFQKGLSI